MLKISQEKMERLFSVETSFTNTFQKRMTLEAEGKRDTQEVLKQLECIKSVEKTLIQEIYDAYGMEAIMEYFEEISSQDMLYPIVHMQKTFDLKMRVFHLFLEHSYQKFAVLKPREEKIMTSEKIDYISDIVFLKNLVKIVQKKVEENVYRKDFTTLKYNLIYTYPVLESILNHEEVNLSSLCFLYHVSYEKAQKNLKTFSEEEASSVVSGWLGQFSTEEKMHSDMPFEEERCLAMLKAYLFSVDDLQFYSLQSEFSILKINASILKRIMELFEETFREKLEEKAQKTNSKEKQYAKKNLLSNIEFYRMR